MRLSEIIPILQKALEDRGDLDLVHWNEEWETHYYVDGAEVVEFASIPEEDLIALVITSSNDIF